MQYSPERPDNVKRRTRFKTQLYLLSDEYELLIKENPELADKLSFETYFNWAEGDKISIQVKLLNSRLESVENKINDIDEGSTNIYDKVHTIKEVVSNIDQNVVGVSSDQGDILRFLFKRL